MTWRTHILVGANVAWFAALFGYTSTDGAILAAAGCVAALLPDIGAQEAKIHHIGGGVLGLFRASRVGGYRGLWHHRGLTHSISAVVGVGLLSLLLYNTHPLLPLSIIVAYVSHLLIDGLNTVPIGYLYPIYRRRFLLVPKSFQTYVGGPVDQVLGVVALMALISYFLGSLALTQVVA